MQSEFAGQARGELAGEALTQPGVMSLATGMAAGDLNLKLLKSYAEVI